jgi:predicted transcriptional regulator
MQKEDMRRMKKKVKDLLKNKQKEVFTIGPKETVYNALKLMGEKEIGALMVTNDEAKF